MFTIPTTFTQGDRVVWKQRLTGYNSATDTLTCFIRGQSSLDLTAVGNPGYSDEWDFEMNLAQSNSLVAGRYKAQFVLFSGNNRLTLGETEINVKPSFENLTELEVLDEDEKELQLLTIAIAKIASGGVAEYYIGTRRARYQDLSELTKRQAYLRSRIARKKRGGVGGRNVGVSFQSSN